MLDEKIPTFAERYQNAKQRRAYLAKRLVAFPSDATDQEIDDLFRRLVHNESLEAKAERREAREAKDEGSDHAVVGGAVGEPGESRR